MEEKWKELRVSSTCQLLTCPVLRARIENPWEFERELRILLKVNYVKLLNFWLLTIGSQIKNVVVWFIVLERLFSFP